VAETRNAFTVDLEEWFHICGAGDALAFEHWDRLPSRVDLTTRIVLDLLDAANVRATFFVVGWVAELWTLGRFTLRRALNENIGDIA